MVFSLLYLWMMPTCFYVLLRSMVVTLLLLFLNYLTALALLLNYSVPVPLLLLTFLK